MRVSWWSVVLVKRDEYLVNAAGATNPVNRIVRQISRIRYDERGEVGSVDVL